MLFSLTKFKVGDIGYNPFKKPTFYTPGLGSDVRPPLI